VLERLHLDLIIPSNVMIHPVLHTILPELFNLPLQVLTNQYPLVVRQVVVTLRRCDLSNRVIYIQKVTKLTILER
jgi:hypothetical protein